MVVTHSSVCCSREPLHNRFHGGFPWHDVWLLGNGLHVMSPSWSLPADFFGRCTAWLFVQAVVGKHADCVDLLLVDGVITHYFTHFSVVKKVVPTLINPWFNAPPSKHTRWHKSNTPNRCTRVWLYGKTSTFAGLIALLLLSETLHSVVILISICFL